MGGVRERVGVRGRRREEGRGEGGAGVAKGEGRT